MCNFEWLKGKDHMKETLFFNILSFQPRLTETICTSHPYHWGPDELLLLSISWTLLISPIFLDSYTQFNEDPERYTNYYCLFPICLSFHLRPGMSSQLNELYEEKSIKNYGIFLISEAQSCNSMYLQTVSVKPLV